MVGPEIVLWIIVAFAALIFISFAGMGGQFGSAVRNLFFGTFGCLAYVVPILIFALAAYLTVAGRSAAAVRRAVTYTVLFLVICALLQLALLGWSKGTSLADYYEVCAYYRTGGGLAGGLLVSLLCPMFGTVGACIILAIVAIICIVIISQQALIATFGEKRGRAARQRMEERARRRAMEARREDYVQDEPEAYDPEDEDEYADHVSLIDLFVPKRGAGKPVPPSVITLEPESGRRTKARATGGEGITITGLTAQSSEDEVDEVTAQTAQAAEPVRPVFTVIREDDTAGTADEYTDETGFDEDEDTPSPEELLRRSGQMDRQAAGKKEGEGGEPREKSGRAKSAAGKGQGSSAAGKAQADGAGDGGEAGEDDGEVARQLDENAAITRPYVYPSLDLLAQPSGKRGGPDMDELSDTAMRLQEVLETFGVKAKVTNVSCGPSVTRYELLPETGVRVSKITGLANDIMLSLAASDIRIEAPIPGKSAVGIEVPNKKTAMVTVRELLESEAFMRHPSKLAYVVGKDIGGKIIVSDIAKMPHLLIAGATGSGKSVFINTLIASILYHAAPEDVRLIMIDPKVVELSVYNGIPHLLIPVVTDPKKAAGALNWGVAEMTKRYELFAKAGVRGLKGYNEMIGKLEEEYEAAKAAGEQVVRPVKLPQIVIIVDELADLMMVASKDVEDAIVRLTQLARAAGIHLVIATQRPSVDVITGLIKANIPSRIAFAVSSMVDSRTILDMGGAEKLLGHGDMLFSPQNYKTPARVQGALIEDDEVARIVEDIKQNNPDDQYEARMEKQLAEVQQSAGASAKGGGSDTDELFADAGRLIIEKEKASIGILQRGFKIGFNRAARIMEQLCDAGVVGPEEGTKPRKLLMSMEDFENYLENN